MEGLVVTQQADSCGQWKDSRTGELPLERCCPPQGGLSLPEVRKGRRLVVSALRGHRQGLHHSAAQIGTSGPIRGHEVNPIECFPRELGQRAKNTGHVEGARNKAQSGGFDTLAEIRVQRCGEAISKATMSLRTEPK